jgi:hypothetical protein
MVGGLSENLPLPTGGDANLQNGTEDLFINSLKVNNLTENLPLKVDSDKDVFSTLLNISDVESLQTNLNNKLQNPYIGTFEATDFTTQNINSVDTSISDLQLAGEDIVYKSVPTTQVLAGDIQIPFDDTSYLVGQELDTLTGIYPALQAKTQNIDDTFTTTNYTKINGNTQTGLLTVKRDDGAPISANTFEIKDALNDVIYSVNGSGQQVGSVFSLQNPTDTRNARLRTNYNPGVGLPYYAGITSVGFGTYTAELPVLTWSCYDGTDGFKNTDIVNFYSNNFLMMQLNGISAGDLRMSITATNTIMTGNINYVTPAGGAFSQIITKTNTNSTAEQALTSTGIGSLIIQGNTVSQGTAYCLTLGGLKSNNNNDTIEIRLKAGANILATTGSITLPALSNSPYDVELNFTIRELGVLASVQYTGFFSYTDVGAYRGANFTGSSTINTTVNNTLSVVSVQSNISNIITCDSLILSKIY